MAKQPWTNDKLNKWLKEGRGQDAVGKDYIPWTKISDFPSVGRATRIFGVKIPRIFHLQSDNQLRCFLIFEWSDRVVDLRESFPLRIPTKSATDSDTHPKVAGIYRNDWPIFNGTGGRELPEWVADNFRMRWPICSGIRISGTVLPSLIKNRYSGTSI